MLPQQTPAPRLRRYLLQATEEITGTQALLPPLITTPRKLFEQSETGRYLPSEQCRLLLGASLHHYPDLFVDNNCWDAAQHMLNLFNEINEYNATYGTRVPLHEESEKLAEIHKAWEKTISTEVTEGAAYVQALLENRLANQAKSVFLCGFASFTPAEQHWLEYPNNSQFTIVSYASQPTVTGKLLNAAVHGEAVPPQERAAKYNAAHTQQSAETEQSQTRMLRSPLHGRISVFHPKDLEQHAFGIQTKITAWIKAGINDIAVVTQDRKFARRLRALLAHRNIPVRDHAGWALSTTSSAAALSQLIPRATEGFTGETLLRLLYSPYCNYGLPSEELKKRCTEARELIISSPHITGSLDETLANAAKKASPQLRTLITRITKILHPLIVCHAERNEVLFSEFFTHLLKAADALGIKQTLQTDSAGKQILDTVHNMHYLAKCEPIKGTWSLWRNWVTYTLEHENFVPELPARGVTFYNLSQAVLLQAQAVILASMDQRYERVSTKKLLLNDTSLDRLNLRTREFYAQLSTSTLHGLIERTDQVMISYQSRDGHRALTPASWLEKLQNFHQLAYDDDLFDNELATLAATNIQTNSAAIVPPLPELSQMPSPQPPQELWPRTLSAKTYQTALNCPYQFFVQYCLGLRKSKTQPDEYSAHLSYGTIVHRCLSALHNDLPDLPGPMEKPWTQEHSDYALQLAQNIINAEFSGKDSADYAITRRMVETQQILKNYINWLIKQEYGNSQFSNEQKLTLSINDLYLQGKLDCIINTPQSTQIIDYKTGSVPTKDCIERGEDVQIGFYALLRQDAEKAVYLGLKTDQAMRETGLKDKEQVADIREQHRQRLIEFKYAYAEQAGLPAWADKSSCGRCDYIGVCRRAMWKTVA